MITVDIDTASLARLRLTPSPAYELVAWLRLTAAGRRHPVWGDPGPAARLALRDPDVALVAATLPRGGRGYTLDLLTPKPPLGRRSTLISEQLERVAETSSTELHRQLTGLLADARTLAPDVRASAADGTFAKRAAVGLVRFWRATLAHRWRDLCDVLDADLQHRATVLATSGAGALLGSLHPAVSWVGSRVEVDSGYDEHLPLHDVDLVLAPSALGWPALATQLCDPLDAVLCYPADGIGQVRSRGGRPAVSALVGSSRATVLADLDVPRSTGELSGRHELAPATVSYHLGVLLRAGLVVRQRDGRVVRYHRTERGDGLVG